MIERPPLPTAAIVAFVVLLAMAVFPPFVPLLGPLSTDDVLPLLAALIVLALLPLHRGPLPIDGTVVGFMALACFAVWSSAWNATTMADFARLAGRSAGRVLFYQVLIVGARVLLGHGRWPRRAMIILAGAATAQALFSIWAYQTRYSGPYGIGVVTFSDWSVLAGRLRAQGTFGGAVSQYEANNVSANFLAGYLVMTIPLSLALSVHNRTWIGRSVSLVALALQAVALYLTYTRAALVAAAFGILAFGFLIGKKRLATAVVVVGIAAALLTPSVRNKFLGEGHDRWALYWASAAITADNAVAGVGDGNYARVLHENQRYHDTPYGVATATSHNSVLLAAASLGLGGGLAHLGLYVMVVVLALRSVRRAKSPEARVLAAGLAGGCLAFMAQDQLNNLAYVPKVATQFWFLVSLLPLGTSRPPTPAQAVALAPEWSREPASQKA